MNPYGGYPYEFYNSSFYNWYSPYYSQIENLPYFNSSFYGQTQINTYPSLEQNKAITTQDQVIKLEQDCCQIKNVNYQKSNDPKQGEKPLKKKAIVKILKTDEKNYEHPPKMVKHKVKYFDPSSAPVVSAAEYNSVTDLNQENLRNQVLENIQEEIVNELQFPEQSENPFILFKYRRIKKRFKKYVSLYDENHGSDVSESDSDNDQVNSSHLSSNYSISLRKRKFQKKNLKKYQKNPTKPTRKNAKKNQSDSSFKIE